MQGGPLLDKWLLLVNRLRLHKRLRPAQWLRLDKRLRLVSRLGLNDLLDLTGRFLSHLQAIPLLIWADEADPE
jgi:hypothetical protein